MPVHYGPPSLIKTEQELEKLNQSIPELKKSIEALDKNTGTFAKAQIALAVILLIVAIVQILVSIWMSSPLGWKAVFVELIVAAIILYAIKKVFDEFGIKGDGHPPE